MIKFGLGELQTCAYMRTILVLHAYCIYIGCELAVDLTFVLDVSVSIGSDEHFNTVKEFIKNVSNFMDIGTDKSLVGVVLFGRDAWIKFDLQQYPVKDDLIKAIDKIVYSDISQLNQTGTNTPAALRLLETAGQKGGALRLRHDPSKPKIAVIVTDGRTNTKHQTNNNKTQDSYETKMAVKYLRDHQIYDHIYAVGIRGNRKVNFEELEYIATDTSRVININDFTIDLLLGVQENLTNIVCNRK